MKKILYVGIGLVAVLVVAATVIYNTHAGQDALFNTAARAVMSQSPPQTTDGLEVVICGSASPLGNDPNRAQACIAVVTPEHFFLFDIGARAPLRINQARLPLRRLDGVFLTHFHSDHISGVPDVNLASWVQGRRDSLSIYGPEGVNRVVNGFNEAYALDRSYRTAHHGAELLPPTAGPMTPVTFTAGQVVWQDDTLSVTAFLVEHPPIEPAVGYRVDYRGRSVVISGDTNASDELFRVAQGADLVLHYALSRTLLDPMIAAAKDMNVPVLPTIMHDVIDYHADSTSLHERAAQAGIGQLAFYHMVPVPANAVAEKMFLRDLPQDIIVAKDLQRFVMPADESDMQIYEP